VTVTVPPDHAELTPLNGDDNKPSNVSCTAQGVFPLPNINLVWTENSTIFSLTEVNFEPNLSNPGLFDVSVTTSVDPLEVVPHDMLSCEIALPGTLFVMRLETELSKAKFFLEETDAQLDIDVEIFSGGASVEPYEGSGDLSCETDNPFDYEIVDENFIKVQMDLLNQGVKPGVPSSCYNFSDFATITVLLSALFSLCI